MNSNIGPANLPPQPSLPKTSGLAITSLVLGILSLSLPILAVVTAIPAIICGHVASSKIKRSSGQLSGEGLAIAGFILGYVGVVVVVLLALVAVPNFIQARETAQRNICLGNLRRIDAAKQQWAVEYKMSDTDVPTENDVKPNLPKGRFSICPKGGRYTIGAVNTDPLCSIPNHRLME